MQLLASGGMGHLYAVSDAARADNLALKLLRPELATKSSQRARFEREARAVGAVRHENGVRLAGELKEEAGFLFFTMELLRGADVADTLAQRGSLSVSRAARIARGAAHGLAALHAAGVVHRDVKPENLFLLHAADGSEVTKVIDFGLAHLAGATVEGGALPKPGTLGTPDYAAPEGLDEASSDPSLDVYALGVVLHELLGRGLPGSSRGGGASDPRPSELDAKDRRLADLMSRMLAPFPVDRPPALEVAEFLSSRLLSVGRAPSVRMCDARRASRHLLVCAGRSTS